MPDKDLRKCAKPDCYRLVRFYVQHCCGQCAVAGVRGHEVDQHSSLCDERVIERGRWPTTDEEISAWLANRA